MNKIKQFLSTAKKPTVIAYEYGIPTGTAGTKGYGNPGEIQVILIDRDNFKTRNSPHIFLGGTWGVRRDYGYKTSKGHCYQARDEADTLAKKWQKKLNLA